MYKLIIRKQQKKTLLNSIKYLKLHRRAKSRQFVLNVVPWLSVCSEVYETAGKYCPSPGIAVKERCLLGTGRVERVLVSCAYSSISRSGFVCRDDLGCSRHLWFNRTKSLSLSYPKYVRIFVQYSQFFLIGSHASLSFFPSFFLSFFSSLSFSLSLI